MLQGGTEVNGQEAPLLEQTPDVVDVTNLRPANGSLYPPPSRLPEIAVAQQQHENSSILPTRALSVDKSVTTDGALSILLVDDNPVNLRVNRIPCHVRPHQLTTFSSS
jgi:hypothetical protein